MRLFDPWKQASEVAALRELVREQAERLLATEAKLVHEIATQVVTLESRIARETLSWGELYDKTYHLQKRIEQRQRTETVPTEDTPKAVDQITERVLARRRRGRPA